MLSAPMSSRFSLPPLRPAMQSRVPARKPHGVRQAIDKGGGGADVWPAAGYNAI